MFPTFDDRYANICKILYFTRDIAESYKDFVENIFRCKAPVPAVEQKKNFQALLGEYLADDGSYEVVQAVHSELKI